MNDNNSFESDAENLVHYYELDKKMTIDQLRDFKRDLSIQIMVESQEPYFKDLARELDRQYKKGWSDGYKTGWNDKKQKLADKTLNKNESPYLEEQ